MRQDQPGRYGFALCTEHDLDELSSLLGRVFAQRDPPAIAVAVTPAEFEAFVRLFEGRAVHQGLTVVAREPSSGRMVGALLAEDAASDLPAGLDRLTPKFGPVFDILGQLDGDYRSGRAPAPGEAVPLFLLGVAREAAGRGLGQRLVEACLVNAAQRGYRLAVTEATNTTSRHVFLKPGFVERVRRSYADYRGPDGAATFAAIAAQGGPILMDRVLATAGA